MKLTVMQCICIDLSCTKFYPCQERNIENMGRILFTPFVHCVSFCETDTCSAAVFKALLYLITWKSMKHFSHWYWVMDMWTAVVSKKTFLSYFIKNAEKVICTQWLFICLLFCKPKWKNAQFCFLSFLIHLLLAHNCSFLMCVMYLCGPCMKNRRGFYCASNTGRR
jgi:hypothetical protein